MSETTDRREPRAMLALITLAADHHHEHRTDAIHRALLECAARITAGGER